MNSGDASSGEQTRGTHEDSGMRDGAEEETLRDGGDNDGCPPAGGGGSRSAEVRLEDELFDKKAAEAPDDDGAMIASLIDGAAEKKKDMELVAALAADAMRRPYRCSKCGAEKMKGHLCSAKLAGKKTPATPVKRVDLAARLAARLHAGAEGGEGLEVEGFVGLQANELSHLPFFRSFRMPFF